MSIEVRIGKDGTKSYRVRGDYQVLGRHTFKTRREAERAEREWQRNRDLGLTVPITRQTVAEYLGEWLETVRVRAKSPNTYKQYKSRCDAYIIPALGAIPLQKLTAAQIEQMETAMLAKGLGSSYVNDVHVVLRTALKRAVLLDLLARDPSDKVQPPPRLRPDLSTWSRIELHRFLDTARESPWWSMWLLALAAGMRHGELVGLRWSDVEFERGSILLRRQLLRSSRTWKAQLPKGGKMRRIDLGPRLLAELIRTRAQQSEHKDRMGDAWQDNDLVCPDAMGAPIKPGALDRAWHRLIAQATVPHVRLHDLRGISASIDLANGFDLKTVSEKLGHSKPDVTWEHYIRATEGRGAAAARAMDNVLFGEEDSYG